MQPDKYLRQIVEPLCSKPESVKVETTLDLMGVLLSLTVDKADMGIIIGKGGETAQSIRLLMRLFGLKTKARITVKITEPDGSAYKGRQENVSDKELLAGIK